MAGIAPRLALGPDETPEGQIRARHIDWAGKALVNATDPASPDFMNFTEGNQPLVDAAFLFLALLTIFFGRPQRGIGLRSACGRVRMFHPTTR